MRARRDHVAGGAFVGAGALVLAVSDDLPFGTLSSPGAGMLPTLIVALMMSLGLILLMQARRSLFLREVDWTDLSHAVRVAILAAAAVAAFAALGFALTSALLLFTLIVFIERRPFLPALAFSIVATATVYTLFSLLLRTPLPRGLVGF